MRLPGGFLAGLRESFQKPPPILVIFEDRLPPIPRDSSRDRSLRDNAQLPSHRHRVVESRLPVDIAILLTDPLMTP
jgi:hypothetical protein